MLKLEKCQKIFIDFDGVIVDSNKFKELSIEKAIINIIGKNKKSTQAINYFNINAGISRELKLSLFFDKNMVNKILKLYSEECTKFFLEAYPTNGLNEFLKYLKDNHKQIKIYILSGGEKNEILSFISRHKLLPFFEDILASNKSKVNHLKEKQVCKNDIFIGDSKNDLNSSLHFGLKFILFDEFKSKESFPDKELIKENVFLKTKNFVSLLEKIIS